MMVRLQQRRLYIPIPFLLVVLVFLQCERASFAGPPAGFSTGRSSRPVETSTNKTGFSEFRSAFGRSKPNTVRLNFYRATWDKVLKKVAKSTGSTLVMQEVPPGQYTRRDFNSYSRTDSLHVLNQALEPKGFRLLENGEYLTVLNMRSLRTKYPRPVIPAEASPNSHGSNQNSNVWQSSRRKVDQVDPSNQNPSVQRQSIRPSYSRSAPQLDSLSSFQGRQYSPIQQMSYSSEQPAGSRPGNVVVPIPQRGRPILRAVRTHRPPADIARMIYQEMKNRSELLDAGPAGLPALRVYGNNFPLFTQPENLQKSSAAQTSSKELFSIGIDTTRSELVISASPAWVQRTEKLIRALDSVPTTPSGTVRLVGHGGNVQQIAQALQPQLNNLTAQQNSNVQPQQPNNNLQPSDQSPGTLILDIRGPVEIEFVPGIGLILRGNEADVEKVRQIINLIDIAAEGTVPEIRLHTLKHVNSQSMAELVNNIYEQLVSIRGGDAQNQPSVNVIPVVNPNAILILAPRSTIDSIVETVEQLDTPIDPKANLNVFRLKYAVASQVATQIESLFPQPQGDDPGLLPRVTAVPDSRTNSVIVQAKPRDMAAVAVTIRNIDKPGPNAVNQFKVIPLKNAVAEELAEVINTTLQGVINPATPTGPGGQFGGGGGQVDQDLLAAKSVILEFLTGDTRGQRIVRSGVLSDIRVTAEPRMNSLLVSAPKESMVLMVEMIAALDKETSMTADIKIIPLENADASAMVDLLETLFSTDQDGQAEVTFAGGDDVSSGLIPLRFSVDVRTNTVIAIGGPGALQVVEAVLYTLDESDIRQRETTVIQLENSFATDVAFAINTFLQSQRDLSQLDPDLISNVELLEQEIIVVDEPVTNSLIISATRRYYDQIMEMVRTLDKAPGQVIIQALLVEVELDNSDEFGVELGFQDSLLFDRGLLNLENFQTIVNSVSDPGTGIVTTTEEIVNSEGIPGFNFNSTSPLGNNTAVRPASIGAQGLSNFSLGRVNGDLGFGGLVLSAQGEGVSVLIRALAARRNVQVLSRPQIRALDNVAASIQVGQQQSVVTGFTAATATLGPTPLVTRDDSGIILTVTPRISPDGLVSMTVIAEKSQFTGQGTTLAVEASTGTVIESPIKDIITVATTVTVPDGQTIVLGGMITKSEDTLERKVPFLGDIPLLGSAFRYDSTSTRRTELLIFLTPRIINSDADSEFINQVESERLHWIREEAEKIHGPIFAIPGESSADDVAPLAPGENGLPMMQLDDYDGIPTTNMSGHSAPMQMTRQLPPGMTSNDGRFTSAAGQQFQQQNSQQQFPQQTNQQAIRKRPTLLKRLFSPKAN
jgi:general secretion pathway protein D